VTAKCEPSLKDAKPEFRYQFERLGYFCLDKDSVVGSSRRDDRGGRPQRPAGPAVPTSIFNRTITLKDTWAKEAKQ
jgi:glutaminyl-tRNA synthetase